MKLTKEVIATLKYHGFMTYTWEPKVFLERYKTAEELGDAGFLEDRGAIDFLYKVFDENGVSLSSGVGEEELEKQATAAPTDAPLSEDNNGDHVHIKDIEPDPEDQGTGKVEDPEPDEGVNEQGPSGDVIDETPADDKKEETKVEEPEPPTPEPTADEVKEVAEAAATTFEGSATHEKQKKTTKKTKKES